MEQITRSTFNKNCSQQSAQNEQALVSFSISESIFDYNMERKPTFRELLDIFPEARLIAKRETKRQIVELQNKIQRYAAYKEEFTNDILTKENPRYHKSLLEAIEEGFGLGNEKLQGHMKTLRTRLLMLDNKAPKGLLDIERAKQTPIDAIIKVGKDKKAKCVWHSERTGSMHCYKDRVHCFGCGKRGDVIDVYRALHGVDFKTAVQALQ